MKKFVAALIVTTVLATSATIPSVDAQGSSSSASLPLRLVLPGLYQSVLTGTQTFDSPNLTDDSCTTPSAGTFGGAFYYHAQPFTVSRSAEYTIANLENSFPDNDSALFLYKDRFNPQHPTMNLIAANDDNDAFNDGRAALHCGLEANQTYILVTSTFNTRSGRAASFRNAIVGNGEVRFGGNNNGGS